MAMQLTIRLCEDTDIAPLNHFVRQSNHQIEHHYFETAYQEQLDGKRIIFLAFYEGVLAGYVHLNFYPQYAPFARLNIPEIQDLFVCPDWRKRGIGECLIRACERASEKHGSTEIGIGVGITSNFGAAQKLYTRIGFMPDGAGVVFERIPMTSGDVRPIDDRMCLMMMKTIKEG